MPLSKLLHLKKVEKWKSGNTENVIAFLLHALVVGIQTFSLKRFDLTSSIMLFPFDNLVLTQTQLGKTHVRILGVQPAFCRKGGGGLNRLAKWVVAVL